ncbi:hypothetical protein HIM_00115 [Hirsutella minnesotensis 3608]|nr:hypothetical protein HIM_00115 [Hirsutella minnesotensis 3608]
MPSRISDSLTTSIVLLEPTDLSGFTPGAPVDVPSAIPETFRDAMQVRYKVFVEEQGCPIECEFDADDSRSCHWVAYADVEEPDALPVAGADGAAVSQSRASTRRIPVGTIRLVPFPHDPHPQIGGSYRNGILQGEQTQQASAIASSGPRGVDRATSLHDGKEPYVKFGRMAVVKEFRGKGLATLLVETALSWLRANSSFFDKGITDVSDASTTEEQEKPRFKGLICAHAQESASGFWSNAGFRVDDGMGKWLEEDIVHIGMFQRIKGAA